MALRAFYRLSRRNALYAYPEISTTFIDQRHCALVHSSPALSLKASRFVPQPNSCHLLLASPSQVRSFRPSIIIEKDIDVEIQSMGESISEGTIAEILKRQGDSVEEDETIAQIETDKVTVDVRAPAAGQLTELRMSVDDTVKVGQIVAILSEGSKGATERQGSAEPSEAQKDDQSSSAQGLENNEREPASSQQAVRKPSISFPKRMVDGKRVSDMSESKRQQVPGQQPPDEGQRKPSTGKADQPKKSQPWYVGKEQGTKLSQSRVLTQREMEQIELGGADP